MKSYKCILVEGDEESVVDIIEKDGEVDEAGNIVPDIIIDHADMTFLLSRTLIPTVFVYRSIRFSIK